MHGKIASIIFEKRSFFVKMPSDTSISHKGRNYTFFGEGVRVKVGKVEGREGERVEMYGGEWVNRKNEGWLCGACRQAIYRTGRGMILL